MKSFVLLLAALAFCSANVVKDKKPDGPITIVPVRRDVSDDNGTIEIIPKDGAISINDFIEYIDSERIVGGQNESPANSNPWQVLVRFGNSLCGGTLLSANFVLTAAHCLPETLTTSSIIAGASTWCTATSAGTYLATEASQQKQSVKTINKLTGNMAYGSKGQLFDIAILEMDSPFTLNNKVKPASLPTGPTPVGTNLVVSGWGTTSEGGSISCTLKQVTVPTVSKSECNIGYGGSIKTSQICAGLKQGGKDSCQGDSGGPLVVRRSSTDATVVGVVSYGSGCARPGYYGVYTDVYTYLPWIKSVLAKQAWTVCGDSRTDWIGDDYCDNEMNNAACLFDAGDCCNNSTPGWNNYCGSTCTCKTAL